MAGLQWSSIPKQAEELFSLKQVHISRESIRVVVALAPLPTIEALLLAARGFIIVTITCSWAERRMNDFACFGSLSRC
jgi:hypothetical protein